MRRAFYCSFAAIFLAIAVHFFPLWTDSFIAVQKGDAYIKVFQCGWPFSDAVSDQLGDQPSTKIFKLFLNFALLAMAFFTFQSAGVSGAKKLKLRKAFNHQSQKAA